MSRFLLLPALASLLLIAATPRLANCAEQPGAAEAKLREALRATTLQLRSADAERATLQAAKLESEEKIKALEAQVELINKQSVAERAASDKSITTLTGRVAKLESDLLQTGASLEKSQADFKKAVEFGGVKEAERAKLAARVIVLDRIVADQRTKNIALYKTGSEILSRYEKFGLGEAIIAREPFTGITRVKLQNLIQEYGDKLADQKIKP
jgi:hypothetical protein